MIETIFLNSYQKEFSIEVGQLKFLFTLLNELKLNFQFIKNISESEAKTYETFYKNLSNQVKIFLNDSSTVTDDTSMFLKFSNLFILIFDKYGQTFSEQLNEINIFLSKLNNEITMDYLSITKGLVENSNCLLKDILNSRSKYRTSIAKAEKIVKELETVLCSKRKLESENSYNLTLREKVEDKILNILNDLEEFKGLINNNFDEVKKIENLLNEFLKDKFSITMKFTYDCHKRLISYFEFLINYKISHFFKIKQMLIEGNNNLKFIEIDFSSNINEKNYALLKSMKYDDLDKITVDESFNKVNFFQITESTNNFMNCFFACINIRKKILWFLLKFLTELIRFSEVTSNSINKLLKNPSTSPKTTVCNSPTITYTFDFLKKFLELITKYLDEWTKLISSNCVVLIDSVIKELYVEESNLTNFWSKFIKETTNFKEKAVKNMVSKEKILINISLLKEEIQKTSDDPNNFTKFENKLHFLRVEEANINDGITDNNRKFRKYLEENVELLKALIKSYK